MIVGGLAGGIPCPQRATGSLVGLAGLTLGIWLVASPTDLHAQRAAVAAGRVVRLGETDTVSVPGAKVLLHRVGRAEQGPVDSVTAGSRGEFRFRFSPDTASVYLLSSGYAGIEYFSTPVHADPLAPDTGLLLVVSDTSSKAPVRVASRHLVIGRPQKDGSRPALEIVVLDNSGPTTRVATESRPSWAARLPKGARNFEVGSGDVSGDAMIARGDSVLLVAPVAPGEKQLLYTYQIPPGPGTIRIPVGDSVDVMNVLLEEFDRTVTGGAIARADSQSIEGRSFRQWNGPVPAGGVVSIDFPGARLTWLLPLLVGGVALSLLLLALRTLRQKPAMSHVPATSSALNDLARLDARYAGQEAQVPEAEWAEYQRERARLKQELAAELAAKKPMP